MDKALEDLDLSDGWIKLYRKSIDSAVFQNEGLWKLWTWCLMKANHEDKWVPVKTGRGTTPVFVKRGQFIFGRKTAAKGLKMKEPTVQSRMLILKNLQNLITQSVSHYSLVTILNYEIYQGSQNDESSSKVSGKYQASITNKNVKNKRIYVEGSKELQLSTLLLREIQKNKPDFKLPNLQAWAKEIDLMLRLDGRKLELIEKVILWAQSDHGDGTGKWKGWSTVILSTRNLRDKFDKIEMQGPSKQMESEPKVRQL
jgi:hypothetical protein